MRNRLKKSPFNRFRNNGTALVLFTVVAAMVGLAFASGPLYRLFCQVTGYAGTTQVANVSQPGPDILDRFVSVRFDANVNHRLPWRFEPVQKMIRVKIGEQALAFYEATNTSDKPIVGTATFNVTPYKAATHFSKIECFCFTEQILLPGQTVRMPVTFFIDPEIVKDKNAESLNTITLSYTFFEDQDQSAAKELTAKNRSVEENPQGKEFSTPTRLNATSG